VLSNDSRHHTNESGTWKAHKIGAEGGHFQIGVVKDTLFLHGTGLRRRMASSYDIEALPESASRVDSIAGRSVNDMYLTTGAGLFHHGDSGWTCVDDTFLGGTLCQDGDAWLTTARRPGSKVVLYRGSAQTGFSELVHQDAVECEEPGDLGYDPNVFRALGKVFVTGSRGVWLLEGERLRRVVVSTGWNGARGDEHYLWVANGTELLCFDGNTWKITPRVLDT